MNGYISPGVVLELFLGFLKLFSSTAANNELSAQFEITPADVFPDPGSAACYQDAFFFQQIIFKHYSTPLHGCFPANCL